MLGNRDASYGAGFRANYKQIIAKRSDLVKFSDGRMVSPDAVTTVHAGLLVGRVSTGPNAGKLKAYAASSSDGSQVPVGFVSQTTEMGPNDESTLVVVITGGQLWKDLLIGLDAGAIAALKAKTIVENGANILDF